MPSNRILTATIRTAHAARNICVHLCDLWFPFTLPGSLTNRPILGAVVKAIAPWIPARPGRRARRGTHRSPRRSPHRPSNIRLAATGPVC